MNPFSVVELLGIIAGTLISIGVIWSKGILPAIKVIKKIDEMYERLEALPDWCDSVDEKLKRNNQLLTQHLQDHDTVPTS